MQYQTRLQFTIKLTAMPPSSRTSVLAAALMLSNTLHFGSCFGPPGNHGGQGMERLYFQTWNVGNICGSNKAPGCRQAAIDYLTSGVPSIGYQPGEGQIMVTMGLLDDDGQAVDLTQYGKLQSLNYSSISGVCNGMNPFVRHCSECLPSVEQGHRMSWRPSTDPFCRGSDQATPSKRHVRRTVERLSQWVLPGGIERARWSEHYRWV